MKRTGDWYHKLIDRLAQVYEPRLPQLAREVVNAIYELRQRLSYSREALLHAVYGLRELLKPGPMRGDKVKEWATKAGISTGLLHLARKLVGVVIHGSITGHLNQQCRWALPGYEDVPEDVADEGGRWQRRKKAAEKRRGG